MEGRLTPSIEDVRFLAPAILRHRMALGYTARAEGVTLDTIIAKLCERLG
jgi:MoxR-like ATPase